MRLLRPIPSWLCGGRIGVDSVLFAILVLCVGALFVTAPLSVLIVAAMRLRSIRRPWADWVGGALVGAVAILAPDLLMHGHPIGAPTQLPYAIAGGFAAGPVYRWLAGKPDPPYKPKAVEG